MRSSYVAPPYRFLCIANLQDAIFQEHAKSVAPEIMKRGKLTFDQKLSDELGKKVCLSFDLVLPFYSAH